VTTLRTERLIIRSWRPEDRPALERMVRDPEMMRYVTQGRTWSDEAVDEMLERQQRQLAKHGVCFGAAELRESGEVIGLVGLQQLDDGEFELGWWIWKDHWGQGFATEAARAFVDHARDVMGLKTLVAVIDPPNTASKAVAEKLGLRFECIKSARETIARREDMPISFYRMQL
jgi:[ribosomal protein S5]-alanine N-acetyltransferase